MSKLLHLIYIHGFQGNDTTFRSFPLDLQNYLSPLVPPELGIKVQTSLYPTYKSVKPLFNATKNFLEWLQTQPPGPVILLGHSMGGLLAAEAATDPSNSPDEVTGKPRRIVGVIAFDTPYLGMHPHVVISGIASLLPKSSKEEEEKLEHEMNAHPDITVVPDNVTDDWESLKRSATVQPGHARTSSQTSSSHLTVTRSSPSTSSKTFLSLRSPSPVFNRVLDHAFGESDNPFVRWLKKHSDSPVSEAKRWVTERFQFGSAMFDPPGLKERYVRFLHWKNGMWVNYWTETVPKEVGSGPLEREDRGGEDEQVAYNNTGMIESGIDAPPTDQETLSSAIGERMGGNRNEGKTENNVNSEKAKRKVKTGRHFIVLPTGLGRIFGGEEHWEKVIIGGVDDEVAAHCGLFIRGQNLDYDGLLERISTRILRWCDQL